MLIQDSCFENVIDSRQLNDYCHAPNYDRAIEVNETVKWGHPQSVGMFWKASTV